MQAWNLLCVMPYRASSRAKLRAAAELKLACPLLSLGRRMPGGSVLRSVRAVFVAVSYARRHAAVRDFASSSILEF